MFLFIFLFSRYSTNFHDRQRQWQVAHFKFVWPSKHRKKFSLFNFHRTFSTRNLHTNLFSVIIFSPSTVDKFRINIYTFIIFPWITNEFYSDASFKCEFYFPLFSSVCLFSKVTQHNRSRCGRKDVYHCRPKLLNWNVDNIFFRFALRHNRDDYSRVASYPTLSSRWNTSLEGEASENINKTSNRRTFRVDSHDRGKSTD